MAENNEMTPEMVVKQFDEKIAEATKGFAQNETIEALKAELSEIKEKFASNNTDELKVKFVEMESAIEAIKENAKPQGEAKKSLVDLIKEKAEAIKNMIGSKSGMVEIALKAVQNPTDIVVGSDMVRVEGDTVRQPVRATRIIDLFRRTRVSTEYVKYREEDVVTRDGKVVVACATSTHNTKKTWITRTVQIAKIRDFVDVCIDMMDDYAFVTSEIEQLVSESIKLTEDFEILLGTGSILSIDSIASEFDPANVLAPYTGAFQSATLAELTGAMKAQIYTFGQERAWDANTVLMNYNDWVKFMHTKNADGDYLLPNFVANGSAVINGMRVVTSPIVAPNTLYVFDSTKGQILDRMGATVEMSYENNDNFEHEVVTVKAVERLQFHVAVIERDAFMKCSDVATELGLITTAP
jgi:HK97 family phage major capsid protein